MFKLFSKAALSLSIIALIVVLLNGLGPATGKTGEHDATVAGKLLLALNVARLYAAEPDVQLAMPVQGVAKSQVGNSWHAPRDGGERLHQGQDIFAPRGTPVLSATDGYVVSVGENRLGGQTVSVMGAGGRMYYYAHLDAYAPQIAVGDAVTKETVLGYVGTTGNAAGTPPHLHFGVYATGGAIDPLPMIQDREPTSDSSGRKAEDKKQKAGRRKR